jgi:hypothetical protein
MDTLFDESGELDMEGLEGDELGDLEELDLETLEEE